MPKIPWKCLLNLGILWLCRLAVAKAKAKTWPNSRPKPRPPSSVSSPAGSTALAIKLPALSAVDEMPFISLANSTGWLADWLHWLAAFGQVLVCLPTCLSGWHGCCLAIQISALPSRGSFGNYVKSAFGCCQKRFSEPGRSHLAQLADYQFFPIAWDLGSIAFLLPSCQLSMHVNSFHLRPTRSVQPQPSPLFAPPPLPCVLCVACVSGFVVIFVNNVALRLRLRPPLECC